MYKKVASLTAHNHRVMLNYWNISHLVIRRGDTIEHLQPFQCSLSSFGFVREHACWGQRGHQQNIQEIRSPCARLILRSVREAKEGEKNTFKKKKITILRDTSHLSSMPFLDCEYALIPNDLIDLNNIVALTKLSSQIRKFLIKMISFGISVNHSQIGTTHCPK